MITAIFSKSKPINLVLVALIIVFGFLIVQIQQAEVFKMNALFSKIVLVILVILNAFIVDFIVKKNALSGQNSFVVLFFALFFFSFWGYVENFRLVFANLFVLLALRKVISLKSQLATTKKIFDAAFWICVASLFHFWTILFLVVLYVGIMLHASNYYKNWLVPFTSMFIVFMIVNAYELAMNDHFFQFSDAVVATDFTLLSVNCGNVVMTLFALGLLVSLFFLPSSIRLKLQKNKLSYLILVVVLIVAVVLMLVSPGKNIAMLIFVYFPLATLFTCFFEKITKPWLQSGVLYCMIFVSVLLCFISA